MEVKAFRCAKLKGNSRYWRSLWTTLSPPQITPKSRRPLSKERFVEFIEFKMNLYKSNGIRPPSVSPVFTCRLSAHKSEAVDTWDPLAPVFACRMSVHKSRLTIQVLTLLGKSFFGSASRKVPYLSTWSWDWIWCHLHQEIGEIPIWPYSTYDFVPAFWWHYISS